VLPFYILHQSMLIYVGYFVLQWPVADALKWLVILMVSFTLTVAFYALLVRPFNAMRILFGMKPRPRASIAPATPAPGGSQPLAAR
jgi:peptidoglycan/LPS O-acetylase OafA/YrhL